MQIPSDEATKVIDFHVAWLMEHFSTVRIFVSKYDGIARETAAISRGSGCHYSQIAQVREWVEERDEETRDGVRTHLEGE